MFMYINSVKKIAAYIISAIIIIVSCVSYYDCVAAADYNLVLSLESDYNKKSSELEVKVVIKNNPGIAALVFQLYYDNSRVELISADTGDIMKNAIVNDQLSDRVAFSYARAAETTDTGVILKAKFKCNKDAAQDGVLVSVQKTDASNFDEKNINVTVSGGNAVILTENDTAMKLDDKQKETLPIYIEEPSVQHVTPYMIITGGADGLPRHVITDGNTIRDDMETASDNEKESTMTTDITEKSSRSAIDTTDKSVSGTGDNQLNPVSHNNHKGVIIIIVVLALVIIVVGVILYLNKSKIKIRRKKDEE